MTPIDWSKAPADATHWDANPNRVGSFMKLERGHWFFWPVSETLETRWHPWNREGRNDLTGLVPRPATWNGEGLPPVGLAAEIKLKSTQADWCPATVLFCQDDALVIAWKAEGVARPTTLSAVDIRPIRTAEQVAAEERKKGVEEMLNHSPVGRSMFAKDFCEALYDAGARMPGEGSKA